MNRRARADRLDRERKVQVRNYRDGWRELRQAGTTQTWIDYSPSPIVPRLAVVGFLLLNPGGQLWIVAALALAIVLATIWLLIARRRIRANGPDAKPDAPSAAVAALWLFGGPSPRDTLTERLVSWAVALAATVALVRVLWVIVANLLG